MPFHEEASIIKQLSPPAIQRVQYTRNDNGTTRYRKVQLLCWAHFRGESFFIDGGYFMSHIAMVIFALVQFLLAYYLQRHLTRPFLMHDPVKEPRFGQFLKRYRTYFVITGIVTLLGAISNIIIVWVVLLIFVAILTSAFAIALAKYL